ncbi:MAG: hypothetical protein ACON4T_10275 [Synechococcus sp.]
MTPMQCADPGASGLPIAVLHTKTPTAALLSSSGLEDTKRRSTRRDY